MLLLKEVNTDMEFSKVMLNTEATAGEKLMLLQGWAPASRIEEISTWLDAQHVYYKLHPRTGRQRAYTVEQQRFLCMVRADMQKLYMLPKYNELDLTPFFAPFFMVFFGFCAWETPDTGCSYFWELPCIACLPRILVRQ